MRNKIIVLENEADGVVSVAVPIAVFEILCGFAFDNQVARCILIETADDIEQRCFTAA